MNKKLQTIIGVSAKWLKSLPATSRWAWICLVVNALDSLEKNPEKPIRWPTARKWESWGLSPGSIDRMTTMAISSKSLIQPDPDGPYEIKGLIEAISGHMLPPETTESIPPVPQDLQDSKPLEGKYGIDISRIEEYMPRRCPGLRRLIKSTISALEADGEQHPIEYIMVMVLIWRISKDGKRGEFAMHPQSFMNWIIDDRDGFHAICETDTMPFFSAPVNKIVDNLSTPVNRC